MMDTYGDYLPAVTIPTLGKDLLSKIKLEHEDSICSDYSLSDIEDALDPNDSSDTNGVSDPPRTFQQIPAAIIQVNGSSAMPDNRFSSDSSGVSSQESPFSTIERSTPGLGSPSQENVIDGEVSSEDQSNTDVRTAIEALESKTNGSATDIERIDVDERDTLPSMHKFATSKPAENSSRVGATNLARQRSLSQSYARSRSNDDSDKNNNNNELGRRTLPNSALGGRMSQSQLKRYNKAMETYRKCTTGEGNGDVKSGGKSEQNSRHRSLTTAEPLYENVARHSNPTFAAPTAKKSDVERRTKSFVKPIENTQPSYAPICPPDQHRNSLSPYTTLTLDYKTILRKSHVNDKDKERASLVNPDLLHQIQDDTYLDEEDDDLVTDIDSFLRIPEKKPTRKTSNRDSGRAVAPLVQKEPDKILWSGLKTLGDSKNSGPQLKPRHDPHKSSLLTKIQKMSLRKTGILVSDENDRASNLRKNTIISKRNTGGSTKSQQLEKFIYLDPASHNGVGMTSSHRQYHTVATPGRLSRIRKESKKSSPSGSPKKKPLKNRSQYSFARKFLRVPTILKNNSEYLERIKPRKREESSSDDEVTVTLTRRYSKSSSDLLNFREPEFSIAKDLNRSNNNNFMTSWSTQSSPQKKSRRKGRSKPSKLVINMNDGSCAIVKSESSNSAVASKNLTDFEPETANVGESSNRLNVELFQPSASPKKTSLELQLPTDDKKTGDRDSFRFTTCQFTDIVSSDATTLDLNIEEYFSFLGTKSNETTPDCENGENSVEKATSSIEQSIEHSDNLNCERDMPMPKSPRKTKPVKRRKHKKRRSGVPSYVPDYIKPAYASKAKRSSACYQLNIPEVGRKPSDPEVMDSMAAFISNQSVQNGKLNSVGNSKTWSGRAAERRKNNTRSKFGSISFARILKANKLKLSIGGYII